MTGKWLPPNKDQHTMLVLRGELDHQMKVKIKREAENNQKEIEIRQQSDWKNACAEPTKIKLRAKLLLVFLAQKV